MGPAPENFASAGAAGIVLHTVGLREETDVVTARQRARQLAKLLGFDTQDQIRLATATSEIARNVIQYARSGRIEFSVRVDPAPGLFVVSVSDSGPGIPNLRRILAGDYVSSTGMGIGLSGTRRIMDHFLMESKTGEGTRVIFAKNMPASGIDTAGIARITGELSREPPRSAREELREQNRETFATIELLRQREEELLRARNELRHLDQELEATNRGVVALYAELDQRAEALRSANEIKTHFLSHMSHEFRTPLNSILALTSLLIRRAGGELTSEQDKQVSYIRRAAEELFEMVNDLLDLAKVESGRIEVKYEAVTVAPFLSVLRGMLRPLTQSDSVILLFDEVSPLLCIRTDEGKLAQILRNLVANALKFTEQGHVRVSVECQPNRVVFRVADTGIGIAPQDQTRIFEEFAQVANPIQKKVRGTGLGLPLSRKLAELLGGTLSVESTVGVGSTFSLELPVPEATCETTEAPEEPPQRQGASILIIDDNERDRYLVRQLLRSTSYRIIEAADGAEGTERARFEHPCLIILDLGMPGMNGFDVMDELKSDPLTKSIPVLVHTSFVLDPADRDRLGGREAAILPKGDAAQERGLQIIQTILKSLGIAPESKG